MATAYKVLAQSAPSATTATTLYAAPVATSTVASTLTVCNRGAATDAYRIAVRPGGATLANEHYIAYDAALPGYSTDTLTIGVTLAAGDIVTVYAGTANLTFALFGSEVS